MHTNDQSMKCTSSQIPSQHPYNIYMNSSSLPEEVRRITERFFVYADNKDLDLNRQVNLVVSPQILQIIFKLLEREPYELRLDVMMAISKMFRGNAFNSIILSKRDREFIQFNVSLLDEIVSFILNIRRQEEEGISGRVKNRQKRAKSLTRGETLGAGNEEQGLGESLKVLEVEKIEKNKLKIDELLSPFIRDYPINCKHIKNVISKVAHDFYFQKFDHELLQMSLQVLMELLRSQRPLDGIPSSFFVMYGEDSGIKLINPNIKWPFSKGFYFYTIFFIEECIRDQMCLLTITVNGGSFEVFIDAKSNLEVRLFNVSKLVSLTRVSPRRWHYLKIGYCLNTGIIRNSYKLTVNFDGVTQERKDLPVPNISISDDITDIIIGRDFYGRINTAALSRCGGFEWNKELLNEWQQVQRLLVENESQTREFFLFYNAAVTTTFNGKEIVYEITSQNHGQLLQNTASHVNPWHSVDVNFYGGLYVYLPFLHILKFYRFEAYPTALEDVLRLLLGFFEGGFHNVEVQATNCQFFSVMSQLINQLDPRFLSLETMRIFKLFRENIRNNVLREQFFLKLLWKLSIRKLQQKVVQALLTILIDFYDDAFDWSYRLMPLHGILRYLVESLQCKANNCCGMHWFKLANKQLDYEELLDVEEKYKLYENRIATLLRTVLTKLGKMGCQLQPTDRVMSYLLYGYSPCFRLMLLHALSQGVKTSAKLFIDEFNVIGYACELLTRCELSEQFAQLIDILAMCLFHETKPHRSLTNEFQIVRKIGNEFDKLLIRKYAQIRIRSRSERVQMAQRQKLRSCFAVRDILSNREAEIKFKISKLKQQRVLTIENDQRLFYAVVRMCFFKDEDGWTLRNDIYVLIVQPYFKICGLDFRIRLIDMIRYTVLFCRALQRDDAEFDSRRSIEEDRAFSKEDGASSKAVEVSECTIESGDGGQSQIKSNAMNQLRLKEIAQYNRLYKFLLTEFVLKQFEPHSSDPHSQEQSNYIIHNVFDIIDSTVISMRRDWPNLYRYVSRLVALMNEVKLDIKSKIDLSNLEILSATRVCIRKFVLRIIKLTERDLGSLANLVFMVYLVVFSNSLRDQAEEMLIPMAPILFEYFGSLEKHLFLDRLKVVNQDLIESRDQVTFVDDKLILETIACFKFLPIQLTATSGVVMKTINAFLDLSFKGSDSELCRYRLLYLSKTNFQNIGNNDNTIRNFLANILTNDESNRGQSCVAEMISLLLSICVQSALRTQNILALRQSLWQLESFFKSFILVCSRDGLKMSEHQSRDQSTPLMISSEILHFLYTLIDKQLEKKYKQAIEESLYRMLCFLGQLLASLHNQLGKTNDYTASELIQLSKVMQHVEQYNFFTFEIIKDLISFKDIRLLPTANKQKAMEVVCHQKLRRYFSDKEHLITESKIRMLIDTHRGNISHFKYSIKASLSMFQGEQSNFRKICYSEQQFQNGNIVEQLKQDNLAYRRTKRIWHKVWKRLRLYHYFWAISMNQREGVVPEWRKHAWLPYKHKVSKFLDKNGARSILEVEPVQPWHVKKIIMDKEFEYRSSNYLYNLHKAVCSKKKQRTFWQRLLSAKINDNDLVFYVDWIKHNSKRKGFLSIEGDKLRFRYNSTFQKDSHLEFTSFVLAEYKPIDKNWQLVTIVNLTPRRYLMKRQCLLISFEDNTSLVFNFLNDDLEEFLRLIEAKQNEKSEKLNFMRLNRIEFYLKKFSASAQQSQIDDLVSKWRNGEVSNFRYLMLLNKHAGRCYLDPSNYPVMPWVVAHTSHAHIEYRDLSCTVGALGSQQRKAFYRSKMQVIDPFNTIPPYQFGTHYSSPGVIFNFMIRLQPYTEAGRSLQGGRFDLSDRLFSSLKVCWNSITSQVSDVRELLPEFYYLPQFLLNIDNHNFGLTQQGHRVHHVQLPGWAGDAYDYIYRHRRQLQSQQVSEHLPSWIDLIFGVKQKGKIAQDNLNLFYYLTYENGINLANVQDQQARISMEAQIMHFGQTPSQIFTKPHPPMNKFIRKDNMAFTKLKFMFELEVKQPMSLLFRRDDKIYLFKQFTILSLSESNQYKIESQFPLVRSTSKENLYHTEDLEFRDKIRVFRNNRFIAVGAYINGDIVVYSTNDGRKVEEQHSSPMNCLYVNEREDLLLCGCNNGLLEVYEIVYGEKDSLLLQKISAEYHMAPITSIGEGNNFYCICSGNLVMIHKIHRGLSYVYEKIKMKGLKMIRSVQSSRKVLGALLCSQPLFCLVFYNALEIYVYSINGQLLKTKQIETRLPPQLIHGDNYTDHVVVLQEKTLVIYSVPQLEPVRSVALPSAIFKQMKIIKDKCYLVTSYGQVMCLTPDE